jgi:hypothetical protein
MVRRFAVASTAAVALALGNARADAASDSEKEQCITAADQGQQLRDDNKYRLARDAFSRCARETCPVVVKRECGQWLHELDERSPTVVLGAQDGKGNDLTDVKVTVDDAPFASTLDGKPALVDPGEHLFRYEAAGLPPIEEHVVIKAGEKNHVLKVQFRELPPSPTPIDTPPAPEIGLLSTIPPAVWVFGGVAIAAFASEAYFGLSGLGDRSSDLGTGGCAPHCPSSEKSSIQTKFVLADVSLGVGLVSAGLATYFFIASRRPTATDSTSPAMSGRRQHLAATVIDFAPRPGGGVAIVGGRF